MHNLAAVLFDMDGLLVDTEPIWTIAEHEAAARLGGEFTPEMKRAMIGHGIDTAVPLMVSMLGRPDSDVPATAEFLLRRSAELFREPGVITTQPGAMELLVALRDAGVPTALVSSSFRNLMDPVLHILGTGWFTVTVAGDEVARRKPDPEPYLTAARRLGVDRAGCVVLEDSPSGARAGVAAGCVTVLVPSMPDLLDLPGGADASADLDGPADLGGPAGVSGPAGSSGPVPAPASGRGEPVPAGLAAIVRTLHDLPLDLLDKLVAAHPHAPSAGRP